MHPSDQDWPRCDCGCGESVPARKANCTARGYVKGEPCRYVAGHSKRHLRKLPMDGRFECARCQVEKPVGEFHADSNRPSGLTPWCKDCMADKARARYRVDHPVVKYQQWPSPAVRARVHASAYRARKRNQFVEHVDPITVFERDAGVCGICDLPIAGPFDVDHIIPLARGGKHSYANAQAAHPSCNYSKKDRIHGKAQEQV